jgi:uncharacterized protein with PIN domain
MDEHVHGAITRALRGRGVDMLTVQQDGRNSADDIEVLDRATELGRVVFTRDADFLKESVRRQRSGEFFGGVVYAHQRGVTVRQCIADLELLCLASDSAEYVNRIVYLPLR